MNGKIQVTGTNGDGPNSLQHSSLREFENNPQYPDSNGSYVNKLMLNGSAYNSPNLANNRRDLTIHERASGDGSLTNPDVIPSESFSSVNDNNNAMRMHENNQTIEAKTNPGESNVLEINFNLYFPSLRPGENVRFIINYFLLRRNSRNFEEK